jgi:hypothetical protein
MSTHVTRRQFACAGAAASLAALLPRNIFSQTGASKKAVIHAGAAETSNPKRPRPSSATTQRLVI